MKGDSYKGKKVVVMGLGLFGGGEGAVRFFAERGACVVVTDIKGEAELAPVVERLRHLKGVEFHLGGHKEEDLLNADIVVVNPAVRDDSPFLAAAKEAGAEVTTEINLLFRHCRAKTVAITGTNGKSTTATLTHLLLKNLGLHSVLGGNIGGSLLPQISRFSQDHILVLELSSFQLERLTAEKRSPDISAILNLTPNHLDRHGDMQSYAAAKAGALIHQRSNDFAVLNGADGWFFWFRNRIKGHLAVFMDDYYDALQTAGADVFAGLFGDELCVGRGQPEWRAIVKGLFAHRGFGTEPVGHNTRNLLAASAAAFCTILRCGAEPDQCDFATALIKCADQFTPLPHRLEVVRQINGVLFVNDSIATNPESVMAALEAFGDKKVVLIAGGYDKGLGYERLARRLVGRTRLVVLFDTEGGRKIASALEEVGEVEFCFVDGMEEAVSEAAAVAQAGDVVLLSPACASFGMFANFAARGDAFKAAVANLED